MPKDYSNVSVPLRGLLFLNQKVGEVSDRVDRVSVPLRGLLFLNRTYKNCSMILSLFPSPYGAYYFSMKRWNFQSFPDLRVSVPLRGLLFLNDLPALFIGKGSDRFRPLTGPTISQWVYEFYPYLAAQFPSPYGAYYFSIV